MTAEACGCETRGNRRFLCDYHRGFAAAEGRFEELQRAISSERYARYRLTPEFPGNAIDGEGMLARAIARVDRLLPPPSDIKLVRSSAQQAKDDHAT